MMNLPLLSLKKQLLLLIAVAFTIYNFQAGISSFIGDKRFGDVSTSELINDANTEILEMISVRDTGLPVAAFPDSDAAAQWATASRALAQRTKTVQPGNVISVLDSHKLGYSFPSTLKWWSFTRSNELDGPVIRAAVDVRDGTCKNSIRQEPLQKCLRKSIPPSGAFIYIKFRMVGDTWRIAKLEPYWHGEAMEETITWDPIWYQCFTLEHGVGDCVPSPPFYMENPEYRLPS